MASGPSLTFISLPRVFASMGGVGRIVGIVFFLALGFACTDQLCIRHGNAGGQLHGDLSQEPQGDVRHILW